MFWCLNTQFNRFYVLQGVNSLISRLKSINQGCIDNDYIVFCIVNGFLLREGEYRRTYVCSRRFLAHFCSYLALLRVLGVFSGVILLI